jgi:hypothetical protein
VALEKVHGSNFCFISNGTDLLAARRNALLDPVETFFSWQLLRDKYATAFHELYRLVRDLPDHSDVTEYVPPPVRVGVRVRSGVCGVCGVCGGD